MRKKLLRWPIAILDIGSNTIRLVVYDHSNPKRAFFSEKVACGLGNDRSGTRLSPEGKARARNAIAGFMLLTRALECGSVHAIATAAIRDARDGAAFVQSLRRDFKAPIKIISGVEEARYSALGVLSNISDAKGVVADLGGGSLELAVVSKGRVHQTLTFPLGTFRLSNHRRGIMKFLEGNLADLPASFCGDLPLYAVGGTGRAIANIHSQMNGKNGKFKTYSMSYSDLMDVRKKMLKIKPELIARKFDVDLIRARAVSDACLLFYDVMRRLGSSKLIITTRGLRDGYLFSLIKGQLG